jgi:plastocyanin
MKNLIVFFLSIIIVNGLNAQTTYTIIGVGDSFSPATVTVNQNDIVRFNLNSTHDVEEVSKATWDVNGTTVLSGGFSFPSGSGDYTASTPGTHYYVCVNHVASHGMKGTIIVNAITAVNETQVENGVNVYPNPAGDFIIYKAGSNSTVHEIRILDLTGKMLLILNEPGFSENQIRIDIANLNKGIYFIMVKSEKGIVSKKFLKA